MTVDDVSAAAGDTIDPTTLAKIPEDAHADDTAMDTGDAETAEKSNLTKSHILVRFAGDGKPLNVAILLKAVLQWSFEIDPAMCLETNNADWKVIKSMNDFPNKEVDFMKCFDPTHNRVGGSSAVIGIHLFSAVSVGLMKKNNTSLMQHLKSKKIGIKTSCGGSKTEVLVCGLLGFNPDKVHRASLTTQIHDQLVATNPDLAEHKLLEKAKTTLPLHSIVPDFELQPRWIHADHKKCSAKGFSIICAAKHADCFRAFLLRCYFEKRVIGLGKLVQLGGRHTIHLPKAITWHNNFVEECAILSLLNIPKNAMDQQFTRKIAASTEEITTICRILLSATEGKATNLCGSCDIECDGGWIVGIDSDKAEHLTVVVAATVSRLWENGQILPLNQSASAPLINRPKPRRKSNETAVSGFDDDGTSVESMHSKAWSSIAMNESGSVPKSSTNRSKPKIHFVFDP
jgi:hypothetical protein